MTEAANAAPATPAEPTLDELAATLFKPDAPAEDKPVEEQSPPEGGKDKPEEKSVSSRITAAKRAELRAEKERQAWRAAEANARATQASVEARQKELDAREARIRLVEEDPVRFFEEFKADPKAFLEKLAGEHKPDKVLEKRLEKLDAKLEKIDNQQAAKEAAMREQAQRAQADASWKAACDGFVAMVNDNADKYPNLVAEFTEAEATEEVYKALHEVIGHDANGKPVSRGDAYRRQFGQWPDDDTIAEFVDARAKARAEARSKAGWRSRQKDTDADPPSEGLSTGEKPAARTVKGSSPRTLTSRASSEKATAPKPWTQEAADEESLRILESAFRKS